MKYLFLLLLSICFLSSCDKEDADIDATEIDGIATDKRYKFVGRSVGFSVTQFYVDGTVDKNFHLGTVWGLKDTTPQLKLTALRSYYKPFKNTVSSTQPTLSSIRIIPGYDAIRAFAKKSRGEPAVLEQSSVGAFFDYRAIRYHLNNSPDVDSVLKLVRHRDSTTIKRANSLLLRREHIAFSLQVDLADYVKVFNKEEVGKLKKTGYNPYYVSSVNYGTHSIIMGESDFPRGDLKNVLEKLLYNQQLTELDKAILNGSDVLVYLRGGRQKSFIRRATGLNPIKKLVADYKNELELQQHSYDYPISYSLGGLNSYGHLKFWYSYDFLVREEKE
ncbi:MULTISPECIES: hypothetical protein [unclassified Sphingobacterium]|uniref:hypothetical protein n=1 Tax=unclassified Sphingobacterium TaxID=2609468 RepID=UPI001AE10526|nr:MULTISPECIES: hypothetical protein [unclassified Sphingobacterium]MDR6734369.1 hypothetical protein [Sphingobacterium sp. 2149]